MVFGSSPSKEQLGGESETLCCWKQQCFALLLLQKQNDGGTYGLIADAVGMLLRGATSFDGKSLVNERTQRKTNRSIHRSTDCRCCRFAAAVSLLPLIDSLLLLLLLPLLLLLIDPLMLLLLSPIRNSEFRT